MAPVNTRTLTVVPDLVDDDAPFDCSGFVVPVTHFAVNGYVQVGDLTGGGWQFGGPQPCVQPLTGQDFLFPSTPNIACATGHRASDDYTEYVDGEIVTLCAGCGERMVLPRVPGGIPYLRLKAFVGELMGLDIAEADDDFDMSEMLGMFGDLKEAIAEEAAAVERSRSLFEIAEAILRRKLAENPV